MRRVLILDFDDARGLEEGLAVHGFDVVRVASVDAALETTTSSDFDAAIVALSHDFAVGIDACRRLTRLRPHVTVLTVGPLSHFGGAASLLAVGAEEFIPIPADVEDVIRALARTESRRVAAANPDHDYATLRTGLGDLVGASAAMQEIYALIERLAPTDCVILVVGETGTGKELVADTLHRLSGRRGPFVAVNCAGIPESLLESELFGHARGAFTDAKTARPGLLTSANEGTLFLDEIGEISLALQAKLLRALQERRVRPVGADRELPFNARIVFATNRDLEAEVAAGRFRPDLYFRIDVIRITLPPLRARDRDVLLLADHFLRHYAAHKDDPIPTLTSRAASQLLAYPWPGNVRELQNCIERAVALCGSRQIDVDDLPERIRRHRSTAPPTAPVLTLAELERRHIRDVLESVGGKKSEASRLLGIDRKTLYRKLDRYGLRSVPSESGEYRIKKD